MSNNLLSFPTPGRSPDLSEVRKGVFIADQPIPAEIKELPGFFIAQQFGVAGERAGKTQNYGQGVMRDIALQMVGLEATERFTVDGKGSYLMRGTEDYDLHWQIFYLMNNPDMIKRGSRRQLLLADQLVHDVWARGEGSQLTGDEPLPVLGKVGHRIVSMLFRVP
tara:strand:- start:604 stop:1098 length:495 start_codon:yes stop_codon:yes gene_type:complete